jgi:hypothetical protein
MKRLIFLGANIYFNSNGAATSGLSKYSDKIQLMADGALNAVLLKKNLTK